MLEVISLKYVVGSLVFSLIGVVLFWVSFIVIDMLTPYDLWREIVKERNQPLAIIVAAMCLGIAIIVAAAIHG
jgi:putative membrane protein